VSAGSPGAGWRVRGGGASLAIDRRMKISELMTHEPKLVTPDDSVTEVAQLMARANIGLVPVCESLETRKLIGVITDRDLVVRLVANGRDPGSIATLHEVMSEEIVTCSQDDDEEAVERLMAEHKLRRILVIDENGSLLGVVSQADLARALPKERIGETVQAISEKTT
jgi:CBS domain-containing protein